MPLNIKDKEVERILQEMYRSGFTQSGVDEIYRRLGLGPAPRVPASLIGARPGAGRAGGIILSADGKRIDTRTGDIGNFLNTFGSQVMDPNREYGVGNYLGLAGLVVGAAGALSGAGAAAGTGSTAGTTGTNLGIFSNGGAGGLAGVGGGNAGALAAAGGISGGAGVGAAGGLAGLGALTGGAGSTGMGWLDTLLEVGPDIAGALLGHDAAGDAADAQERGAREAIAETRRQYDQTREDFAPYREAGYTALRDLTAGTQAGGEYMRDFTMDDFQRDPGYEFRLNEGRRALEGSAAASGGLFSGATGRRLERYGQDYASNEYGNAEGRFQNNRTARFNRLASLAGVGQTATGSTAAAGQNASNNIADATIDAANARAAGRVGEANAVIGGVESLGNWYRNRRYGGTQPQGGGQQYPYGMTNYGIG